MASQSAPACLRRGRRARGRRCPSPRHTPRPASVSRSCRRTRREPRRRRISTVTRVAPRDRPLPDEPVGGSHRRRGTRGVGVVEVDGELASRAQVPGTGANQRARRSGRCTPARGPRATSRSAGRRRPPRRHRPARSAQHLRQLAHPCSCVGPHAAGDLGVEGVETLPPERADLAAPLLDLVERTRREPVDAPLGDGLRLDDTGLAQHPQVPRDAGARRVEECRDLARGQLLTGEVLDDGPPGRVGQRFRGRSRRG